LVIAQVQPPGGFELPSAAQRATAAFTLLAELGSGHQSNQPVAAEDAAVEPWARGRFALPICNDLLNNSAT
jgi:hypothetical protein